MSLLHTMLNVAKARVVARLLRRGLGANLATAIFVAYAGKKVLDAARKRRTNTA